MTEDYQLTDTETLFLTLNVAKFPAKIDMSSACYPIEIDDE